MARTAIAMTMKSRMARGPRMRTAMKAKARPTASRSRNSSMAGFHEFTGRRSKAVAISAAKAAEHSGHAVERAAVTRPRRSRHDGLFALLTQDLLDLVAETITLMLRLTVLVVPGCAHHASPYPQPLPRGGAFPPCPHCTPFDKGVGTFRPFSGGAQPSLTINAGSSFTLSRK